ncbi:MAG: hypothetical protein LBE09_00395 [Christensenellaceae bacterium]|nr:hypothetical protein [Christensenellaceae bacterium]
MWFLVDGEGDIHGQAPKVRLLKRIEKLSDTVLIDKDQYGDFSELLEKAHRAWRDG